ncbi:LuxR C-terminal-related transcriptional regulator [Motilibacter peucedani]|uniref:LuxR C-terminal-related transcriptional regulator n=1 Tax=Motilibacter peucedani TaxID=598650 RepID=UPI0011C373A4|nr:LuxR family transcriptional regulator [Motilibacter peucedani]
MSTTFAVREPASALAWPLVARHAELEGALAALQDRRMRGWVAAGPPGVGKTRLAEEVLGAAAKHGYRTARVTASRSSSQLPFGSVAHLLPAEARGVEDPVTVFDVVLRSVREQVSARGGSRSVVLVDDLHLLDGTSATMILRLLDEGLVFLLATVRSSEPVDEAVSALWRGDGVRRVDLGDLPRRAVQTLMHLSLRGPVDAGAADDVWETSRGNPLYVRELVLGALDSGALQQVGGAWRLVAPLSPTPRLVEVVAARLDAVPDAGRRALELLAVAEPVSLDDLLAASARPGSDPLEVMQCLEALERAGTVRSFLDGRRTTVRLAHPLYGEVLRAQLPELARRRAGLVLSGRVKAYGARRYEDPLRIATMQLDATGTADTELLVRGARLARHGYDLLRVARLARAALAQQDRLDARLLLGEALYELGEFDEAEQVLDAALDATTDDVALVRVASVRTALELTGRNRPPEALRVVQQAASRARTEPALHALRALEALVLGFAGRAADAVALADAVVGDGTPSRAAMVASWARATGLTLLGRAEIAVDAARRGFAMHEALPEVLAVYHVSVHLSAESFALQECGRLAEALEVAERGYALATRDRSPWVRTRLARMAGRAAVLAGQPRTAVRWYVEGLSVARAHGHDAARKMLLDQKALAHALLGELDEAERALAESAGIEVSAVVYPEHCLGQAWTLAGRGHLGAAHRVLEEGAARAASAGDVSSERRLLHDRARLGEAGAVADRLEELRRPDGGPLADAYALHARALRDGDPTSLAEVAASFERLGCTLLAAEAWTSVAAALRRRGSAREGARAAVTAKALVERCEGAVTPALRAVDAVVPLTRREREVASLAATGLSSKDVADRLVLSVRTVDNHLQAVYAKLGVSSRADLARALRPGGGG